MRRDYIRPPQTAAFRRFQASPDITPERSLRRLSHSKRDLPAGPVIVTLSPHRLDTLIECKLPKGGRI